MTPASARNRLVIGLIVILLAGCAAEPVSPRSTGEYIDDTVITTKVKTALLNDETVEGLDIAVETFRGVVQLSGFVDSREDIRRAVELAREVAGVRSVRNSLRLKSDY